MTRKDYINIAAAFLVVQERIKATAVDPLVRHEQLRGVRRAAAAVADFLQEDNPHGFDPVMFLKNCGYGAHDPYRELFDQGDSSDDREPTWR